MERYEIVKDIGSGNFGVAKLVLLTPTHLAIVMEYAAGGELFERICNTGRFSEDEARFFFQQLISGVSYCHSMQICHRDLKLENTLLDGSIAPRVRYVTLGIQSLLCFILNQIYGRNTAYIAPEVLSKKEYDGKRILSVRYTIPDYVRVSMECRHLLSRIFVANPEKRITIPEIKNHTWFLKNLPIELMEGGSWQNNDVNNPSQSIEEVLSIIQEARKPVELPKTEGNIIGGSMDLDDVDADVDYEDIETSGEFVCPL
ncbi:hypothetical protein GH714_025873 [Hevea brasiliensis]|uniref:non-specific serine/threonine protein kinase n=1 Tax=Hevea brasiliensis TaxID=3981 RepID=A0A6A6KUF3_HEVBR|nr:hypothetical protein GH714_025873 [Hevea brasiliensis]